MVRGPVGSLARPDVPDDFEAFDAGAGTIVYVARALLQGAPPAEIAFQFGARGLCTVTLEP